MSLSSNCRAGHLTPLALLSGLLLLLGSIVVLAGRARAEVLENCPNEVVRSESNAILLPDCRAYEMVTPPYKEGYSLRVESLSSDGDRAILASLATLDGNPGSIQSQELSGLYLDTRTSNGWQLSPLNPPDAEFIGYPVFVEADDGDILWVLHTPKQPLSSHELYLRSAAGDFDFIGPLSPTETEAEANDTVAATTADFRHDVIEAHDFEGRWSFDRTAGNETHSLYEYSGTNKEEPLLVGVVGEKGSRQLIATCGTVLGSGEGTTYNAISRDGETIFFTVNPCGGAPSEPEIYARLNGATTSPRAAETVNVSESECTSECDEAVSGKNFEGASENGQQVFFTSTQKLTNSAIDGTSSGSATLTAHGCAATLRGTPEKPAGCNLYEYNFADKALNAISIGGEVLGVIGIAEDGSRVYYVTRAEIASAGRNVYGNRPIFGQPNMYVYNASSHRTVFVTTLGEGDEHDWLRPKRRSAVLAGNDGRVLLFASSLMNLTPDDTHNSPQLFEYKAAGDDETAELVRITKGEGGFNEDGNGPSTEVELAFIENIDKEVGYSEDHKSTTDQLNISANGDTVFFKAGLLSPRATASTAGCPSLYEFHTDGALSVGGVHLVSDGQDTQVYKPGTPCGVKFQAMDASGSNVLLLTADPLLSSDVDGTQFDIYDARTDGGFGPSPGAGACVVEFCEGTVSAPPAQPPAGVISRPETISSASPMGIKVPAKARRDKIKACKRHSSRHGKCVRRRKKIHARAVSMGSR